jgi:hypothetical protein
VEVDLGQLRFEPLVPMTRVRLVDGPCAGVWAEVPERRELWQRVGAPGRPGVETQMWARYDFAREWEYVYSGITVTTDELQTGLDAMQRDGHSYGESYGA